MDLVATAAPSLRRSALSAESRLAWLPAVARWLGAWGLGALWFESEAAAVFCALVVVAWWGASTRAEAAGIGGAYQLGATWALRKGAAAYLGVGALTAGVAIALVAAVVALGWGACWVSPAKRSVIRIALAMVGWLLLTTIPYGLGTVAVAHPLSVAGGWFPGAGWMGLVLTGGLLTAAAWPWGRAIVLGMAVVSAVRWQAAPPRARAVGVAGSDTASAPARSELDAGGQYDVAMEAQARARRSEAKVVVLPEGAAGLWTDPMRSLWSGYADELTEQGRTVLAGTTLERGDGKLEGAVVVLGAFGEKVVRQRVPVPIVMWRPWSSSGFVAHPFESGVVEANAMRLGVLVCWEGALVLPALLSAAHGADVFVLLANHWWVGELGRPLLLGAKAWGALFGVPVVIARNAQGGEDG